MVCKLVDLLLFLFYMRAVIKFYAYASCCALRVSVGLIGVEILANFDATRNFPNKRCCVLLTLMFEVALLSIFSFTFSFAVSTLLYIVDFRIVALYCYTFYFHSTCNMHFIGLH
uniref:Secreted peptide n=1 Tax=Ascaris lumbricoides TaxID=6252 RepID=A0A0M3IWG6_ASCLU